MGYIVNFCSSSAIMLSFTFAPNVGDVELKLRPAWVTV